MIFTKLFNSLGLVRDGYVSNLSVDLLESVKRRLLRTRQYFRALTKDDRNYLELCIKCKPKFKSPKLLLALTRILSKIVDYLKSFDMRMREIGKPIVMKISMVAYSWGNKDALNWKEDQAFTFYWGLHSRDWGLDRMSRSRRRQR